jgi:hypothetical protein
MPSLVAILAERREAVMRREWIAPILERNDVMHLDRLDQAPLEPAALA